MISLTINSSPHSVDVSPDTPLLWVIRDLVGLKGTKFGCGMGVCGACTVHMDGEAIRSCQTPVSYAVGKKITTIEGLSQNGDHPVQKAWEEVQVPQCGYCQVGQMMNAAAFLARNPHPSEDEIMEAMNGNICRCGTYLRIKKAIQIASGNRKGI